MRELVFVILAVALIGTLIWLSRKSTQKRFPTMYIVSLFCLMAFYLFQYGNLASFDMNALSAQARFVREKRDEVVQDATAVSDIRHTLDRLLKDFRQSQTAVEEAQGRIALQETQLSNLTARSTESARLAQIHEWTIRAESGDRAAFVALQKYVADTRTNSAPFVISFAQKNVNRIYTLFSNDKTLDPGVALGESPLSVFGPTNQIPADLRSQDYVNRVAAVSTIGAMRLNSYTPQLADMAFEEPDLHVLQVIVKTIEKAFAGCAPRSGFGLGDFLFPYGEGRKKFDEQWAKFGPELLQRKPKYIISEPFGSNGSKNTIIDPEAGKPFAQ